MAKDWIHGEKRISGRWIFRDFFFRIFLYFLIPFITTRFFPISLTKMGFIKPTTLQILVALLLSFISFSVCLFFRSKSKKKRQLHPVKDLLFSLYSFFINAPSEEFFFRGFIFYLGSFLTGSMFIGLVISSFLFGFQHFIFFGASLRSVFFDIIGGFFFGIIYICLGKSLIPVTIVHGISNLAIFTVGNYILQKGGIKSNETNNSNQ